MQDTAVKPFIWKKMLWCLLTEHLTKMFQSRRRIFFRVRNFLCWFPNIAMTRGFSKHRQSRRHLSRLEETSLFLRHFVCTTWGGLLTDKWRCLLGVTKFRSGNSRFFLSGFQICLTFLIKWLNIGSFRLVNKHCSYYSIQQVAWNQLQNSTVILKDIHVFVITVEGR